MGKRRKTGHDIYFKQQFRRIEFARSFLFHYLPSEVRNRVDWSELRLASGDYVARALKNRRSDIVYETRIAGQKSLFYIHLEHQRSQDPGMAFRILVYTVSIWEQFRAQYPDQPLPLIYPMVIYQGNSRWTAPTTLHDMLDVPGYLKPYCPQMSFGLMDLTAFSDEEIQGELFVQLALAAMKHIDSPEIAQKLFQLTSYVERLLETKTGIEYIEDLLYYLVSSSPHLTEDVVIQEMNRLPQTTAIKERVMTILDQREQRGIKKGIEKGIEKGLKKGVEKGEVNVLIKQLNMKFREEAGEWIEKLNTLPPSKINEIAERILTKNSLEEIFDGIIH